jgi:nucleoside transporter
MRLRLSVMMFLEYFIWGAWYVTIGTWLGQTLHFSGDQIGIIAGTTTVGAIVSPFLVGLMADELFANQHLLAVLHGVGGILLWFASTQTHFGSMYALLLIYSLLYMPTMALTNALAFRQMKDPAQDFGSIRGLGTAGWIVAGLTITGFGFFVHNVEATAVPIRMAAVASILFGAYALTLPHTPPLRTGHGFKLTSIFPPDVFGLFKNRNFAIFAIASFLICIPLQFYYSFTNLFLNEIGFKYVAAKMSMGQMAEVLFMFTLTFFYKRLGVKRTLMLGMLAWVARLLAFGYGNTGALAWMLYTGIILHGICYDFFFVMGQVYVDQKAPSALRSAAQGLMTFLTYGIGMFVGSLFCGRIVDTYKTLGADGAVGHNWRSIWMVPAALAAIVLVFFALGFRSKEVDAQQVTVAEAGEAKA